MDRHQVRDFAPSQRVLSLMSNFKPVIESFGSIADDQGIARGRYFEAFSDQPDLFVESTLAKLKEEYVTLEAAGAGNEDALVMMQQNVEFIEALLNAQADDMALMESHSVGSITTYSPLRLPYLYLQTIMCVGNKIMSNKVADRPEMIRSFHKRYVTVDGTKHFFPDALKDKTVVQALKAQSLIEATCEVTIGTLSTDLQPLIAGAVAGDALISSASITHVFCDNGNGVPAFHALVTPIAANSRARGVFQGSVTIKDNNGDELSMGAIGGTINFDEMTVLNPMATDSTAVTKMKVAVSVSPSSGRHVITPKSEKTDHVITITEEIKQVHTLTKQWLKDKKIVENVDATMEILSSFLEISNAIKDNDIFGAAEEAYENEANIFKRSQNFYMRAQTGYSGHEEDHKEKAVRKAMLKLMTEMDKIMNVPAVFKFWGDRNETNEVHGTDFRLDSMGGIKIDYSVRAVDCNDFRAQVISTERGYCDGSMRCIPTPTVEHEETFTFWQYDSEVEYDHKHPDNLLLPAVSLTDRYTIDYVYPIIGQIDFIDSARPE